jgi:hypothetical protein
LIDRKISYSKCSGDDNDAGDSEKGDSSGAGIPQPLFWPLQ